MTFKLRTVLNCKKLVKVNTLLNTDGSVDKDELILHTNFSILVDFIEIELALEQIRWFESDSLELDFREYFIGKVKNSDLIRTTISIKDRLKIMLYNTLPKFIRSDELIRSKELGLKRLNFTISDESSTDEEKNIFIEIKKLYLWWVQDRKTRIDVDDASGYNEYMNSRTDDELIPLNTELLSKIEKSIELEQQYYNEDTEMLKRLMDIRNALWT